MKDEPSGEQSGAPLPAGRAFVVQLRAQAEQAAGFFVGRVEHIASGEACRFASAEELLAFMAAVLASAPRSPATSASKKSEGNTR
jgi:hypothetical protein